MVADHQGGGHQGGVTTDYSITVVELSRCRRIEDRRAFTRSRARSVSLKSVERLHLHEPVVVVAADPERHRSRRIVDEYRPHVRVGWHEVLHHGAGLWIEPHDAVGVHGGGPQFTVLVKISSVWERVVRQLVFRELLGLGVE